MCMYVHACKCMYMYAHVCKHVCMYVCMYVEKNACMHACRLRVLACMQAHKHGQPREQRGFLEGPGGIRAPPRQPGPRESCSQGLFWGQKRVTAKMRIVAVTAPGGTATITATFRQCGRDLRGGHGHNADAASGPFPVCPGFTV